MGVQSVPLYQYANCCDVHACIGIYYYHYLLNTAAIVGQLQHVIGVLGMTTNIPSVQEPRNGIDGAIDLQRGKDGVNQDDMMDL